MQLLRHHQCARPQVALPHRPTTWRIIRANLAQGIRRFFVTDDNFARNKNWESILDSMIELREVHGFPIRLILQVDTLCHRIPGFIEKAARAGCATAFIGLENINPESLAGTTGSRRRAGLRCARPSRARGAYGPGRPLMTGKSLTVTVSQVQTKSDYLLNEIARHGTTVIVTRLGKPLGRHLPHDPKRKRVSSQASQKLADRRK